MIAKLLGNKILMGDLAVAIMYAAYAFQIRRTLFGGSKPSRPNPIAWIGFGFLTGVGYFAAAQKGAASGSWVMGQTSVFCFIVACVSYFKHKDWWEEHRPRWDHWAALGAGTMLFALYLLCRNKAWGPVISAVLTASADVILYEPIFTDTYRTPHNECATAYALNSLKFVPSLSQWEV